MLVKISYFLLCCFTYGDELNAINFIRKNWWRRCTLIIVADRSQYGYLSKKIIFFEKNWCSWKSHIVGTSKDGLFITKRSQFLFCFVFGPHEDLLTVTFSLGWVRIQYCSTFYCSIGCRNYMRLKSKLKINLSLCN